MRLGVSQGISTALPTPFQSIGSALARGEVKTRLSNLWWERRLGITTGGVIPVSYRDSHHYATMNYTSIWAVMEHLDLGPSDVFVDIGCGKGRVLCCAARRPVGQVVGVDLSEPFCETARENARRMRGRRASISVVTTLADEFDYSSATALFLFDPFGPETLGVLLERIRGEVRGSVRIAYANPTHDAVFQRQTWLELTERWDRTSADIEHSVSFYRNV